MPRPRMQRRVKGAPNSSYFKPAGIRTIDLEESVLHISEFEAIRLIDYKELSQEEAANKMRVSQPTLSRTLKIARKKLAEAIIEGKAIKIEKSDTNE